MAWYYAGPDAKPAGPVSLEELHARRASGAVSPETYVIEHTGQPAEPRTWKRYRELFPTSPALPPPFAVAQPPAPLASFKPHPLFPSAAASGTSAVFKTPAGPDPFYAKGKTNAWCWWGFALGAVSFFLSFFCIGFLVAIPALAVSFVGIVQVQRHRDQGGHGLAIGGLLLSCAALLISVAIATVAFPMIKAREQTTTEQSTNDSD